MRALVTGAAGGIGQALSERLVSEGWQVIAVDRDPLPETLAARGLEADLSDRAAVDQLVGTLLESGPFDMVIHNAGISATGPVSYTHLTLPTTRQRCRSRWGAVH